MSYPSLQIDKKMVATMQKVTKIDQNRGFEKKNPPVELLLRGFFGTQSRGRTGTGVNLLVFETSASTDSAIWASFL